MRGRSGRPRPLPPRITHALRRAAGFRSGSRGRADPFPPPALGSGSCNCYGSTSAFPPAVTAVRVDPVHAEGARAEHGLDAPWPRQRNVQ